MIYTRKPDISGMTPAQAVQELERVIRLMMEQTEIAVAEMQKKIRTLETRVAELEGE